MRDKPGDLDEDTLAGALTAWGIEAAHLEHAPVGFGDHHWTATGADGRRWFLTAADLGSPAAVAFDRLGAALGTAVAVEGLGFVVAPVPARDGTLLRPLGPRYALSVFPYVEGETSEFGDELTPADREKVIDLLAELHATPPPARTPARPLELGGRARLERALAETGSPWTGGPYAEPARALVAEHAASLRRALSQFDRAASRVGPPVLTHGEPHPGNLLRQDGRFLLVDWDTVGLAAPERDLWLVARDPADLARYAARTGRAPDPAVLDLYRLRWSLDDVAEYVGWFRAPHTRTPDTDLAWRSLAGTLPHLVSD